MNKRQKAAQALPDGGPIFPDSEIGIALGLNTENFSGDTYLWKQGTLMLISFIAVKNEGQDTFSQLLKHLFSLGFTVGIPTPLRKMKTILKAKGFRETWEEDPDFGACEIWVKEPPLHSTVGGE